MTRLLNIDEVSERTRIPVASLRWYRNRNPGKGPRSAKIGARVMYREDDVEAWIAAQFDEAA